MSMPINACFTYVWQCNIHVPDKDKTFSNMVKKSNEKVFDIKMSGQDNMMKH